MKQLTTKERLYSGKGLIDSPSQIKIRDSIYPFLLKLSKTKVKYNLNPENSLKTIEGHPKIFVFNHYSAQDTPIACNCIGEKAYILVGKQNLKWEDNLFFNAYGSIFVDRKDKEDMALSKLVMESYLKIGKSLIVFPEGTWNLDAAKLMLPMKWGIIEVAQNTDAQIIPIRLHYDREDKKCDIKYGEPRLYPKGIDKAEAINSLRDEMGNMIWEKIRNQTILERSKVNVEELEREYKQVLQEYPQLDPEYEESIVFRPNPSPEEVFGSIKLNPKKENAFLLRKKIA